MDYSEIILVFKPDPDALVATLRPGISDAAIELLAHIDYGYGANEVSTELIRLRDAPYEWRPISDDLAQVVELASFGPPFANYTGRESLGPAEIDVAAAFNCANILRGLEFGSNYHFEATIKSVGVLLGQAMVIPALGQPLAQLLSWNLSKAEGAYRLNANFVVIGLMYLKWLDASIGSYVTHERLAELANELELWRQNRETGGEDLASMFRRDDEIDLIRPVPVWAKIADALLVSEVASVAEIGVKLRRAI